MTKTEFIPPTINGVSASKVFLPTCSPLPKSVYEYLCHKFPHIALTEWQQRFAEGLIFDTTGHILNLESSYIQNSHIFYYRFLPHEILVPFEYTILFENEHLLVVDKPHFLTMSPTGKYVQQTLLVRLKQQTGNDILTPIHRLDRETAGVVLFSKQACSRAIYQEMFAKREVKKTYHAIAPYDSDVIFPCNVCLRIEKGEPFYTMQVVAGTVNSETEINLLEHNTVWGKYQLQPITGKQHQLRVHLNHLRLPIKNDPFYPVVEHKLENDFSSPLQLLAKHIRFIDPISLNEMSFSSHFDLTL